jgi:hypothetical protein
MRPKRTGQPVAGGTGRYQGASDQVLEIGIGSNSKVQFGTDITSPNSTGTRSWC